MNVQETGEQMVGKTKDGSEERRSRAMIHSVSIVVETVHDDCDAVPSLDQGLGAGKGTNDSRLPHQSTQDTDSEEADRQSFPRKERHQSSPIIFLDHEVPGMHSLCLCPNPRLYLPSLSESKPESGDQQSVQSIIVSTRVARTTTSVRLSTLTLCPRTTKLIVLLSIALTP